MALGDPYATLADLKGYIGGPMVGSAEFDVSLTAALNSVSRKIEGYCGRQFNLATTESTRVFRPNDDPRVVQVDDFVLSAGFVLKTDPGGNGNFDVVWTAPLDYELEPLNGVVNGQPGWPFYEIHAVAGVWFPLIQFRRHGTVQVTAQWGWPAVPDDIHQATLILAASYFALKDAPFGVAGFGTFGSVKVRDNPMACALLEAYMVDGGPVQVG